MDPEIKRPSKKEQAYIDSYLIHLNKCKAAQDAGYSEKSARQTGYEIYNRLHIKAAIDAKLLERTITADETVKLVSDISQANMTDYFRPVKVIRTPRIKVSLQFIIDRIADEIDFEEEYRNEVTMTEEENDAWFQQQQGRRDRKLRYEIELRRNPNSTRIIDGEAELVTEMQLDIDAVVADKERGKIKSVKYTKDGIQIEMYSALDAAEKLLKVHGAYEKDNRQREIVIHWEEKKTYAPDDKADAGT